MYTVYGRCGQYAGAYVHTLAGAAGVACAAGAWFIRTRKVKFFRENLDSMDVGLGLGLG